MTIKEAIAECSELKKCIEKDNMIVPLKESDGNVIMEVLRMAITAFEQQEQKKESTPRLRALTIHEGVDQLLAELEYWKREAISSKAKLGEIRILVGLEGVVSNE